MTAASVTDVRFPISGAIPDGIRAYTLGEGAMLPLVVEPAHDGIVLADWNLANREWVEAQLLVHGGVLYTPPIDGTLLTGITRDTVIKLAADLGITVMEKPIPRDVLYIADEVFLSGTASEVTPVRSIDKLKVGDGTVGPITRRIQNEYLGICKGEIPDRHGWLTRLN